MKATKRNIREVANAKRQKRRDELISIVNNGIRDVGKALIELRDDEHWRDTHNSFSDFCRDNFKISKTYLYDVIKGMEVIASLPKDVRSKITNEGQARALAKLPESKRVGAILGAEKNGGITAESLLSHATKRQSKPSSQKSAIADSTFSDKTESKPTPPAKNEKPAAVLDCIGTPIPPEALPFWNRRQEVQDLMTRISEVKCVIEKAKLSNDMLYGGVSNNFVVEMRSAYAHIKDGALPHAVCTQCQGIPSMQETGCSFCNSTGLIPEWKWNTQSIKEVKEMRIKIAADLAVGRLK